MPNRIIKESIWTSPNLNQLSDLAERHFYRILLLPDDFGCCELTALVVKGRCYPLRPDISVQNIDIWQQELEDKGLIIRWNDGNRQYAIFPSFGKHQRIRSLHQRKTPTPPDEIITRCDDICRQMSASDGLNPNHNPIPNHNLNPNPSSLSKEDVFEIYKKEIAGLHEEEALGEFMENEISVAITKFSESWVVDAIREAVKQNRKNWAYVAGILNNWRRFGKGKTGDPDKYVRGKYGHRVQR